VQLLHNTNVPSCYAAADNRLRQSADWCRCCCRMRSPPLRAIRRRWLPALARIAHAKQRPDRPVAMAVACKATPVWAAGSSARRATTPGPARRTHSGHGESPAPPPLRPAPPRHAPPRPATPRPASPRHATPAPRPAPPRPAPPRPATPVVRDLVAGPVPHWSGRCSSATSEQSAIATRPSQKAEAAAEAAAVPWRGAVARDAWRTGAGGAAAAKQFWRGRANQQKKEGYMYPSFFCYPSAPRTSLCSKVRGTARHRRLGLRCLGAVAVGRFHGFVLNFRFYGKTRALMCRLGAVGLRARWCMLVPAWAPSFASEVTVRLAAGAPARAAPSGSRGAGLTRRAVSARQGRSPFPGASRGQDAGFLGAG
jgi:hypothetical protein